MVHRHRRSDDSSQNLGQINHSGAARPRPRSGQSRKGDSQSAGNRGARSTNARALGEMRPSDVQLLGPARRSVFFCPAPSKTRPAAMTTSATEQMAHWFERDLTKTRQTESFEADRAVT